ncbi:hypothetical protein [Clostridium polynesiense]|uniref:hypothetical protein n=1 Tax=Clostridium polynesiense TaxID=1325933 RepID=UPI000590C733|nr:hypothetical protein [Clostridium polynesiense]
MRKNNIILGVLLIIIGFAYFLKVTLNLNFFSFSTLWPGIVFFIGVMFEVKFFRDRSWGGNLIPGGIFMVIGLVLAFQKITGYRFSQYIWPFYIFSLSAGFLQYYFFYKKDRAILLFGMVFLIIFMVSFLSNLLKGLVPWISGSLIFPILLIAIGVIVIFKK